MVDDFIDRLVVNKTLNKNPAINAGRKASRVMAREFKKSLDKYKVPAPEQQELFDIVGKTKADIVTKP